jgi:[ribosomal protein S5]-alanine N-acetyltransferase
MTCFASFPRDFPELRSNTVLLRQPTEQDIPAWYARATDAESAELAGDPIPKSIDEGALWLQKARDRFDSRTGLRWAIVAQGAADSVGSVGLLAQGESQADVGIVIARKCWSQGIATAALELVAAYAFKALAVNELQAQVLRRNPASIRLLEKTGFTHCGVIPSTDDEPEELLLYQLRGGHVGIAR